MKSEVRAIEDNASCSSCSKTDCELIGIDVEEERIDLLCHGCMRRVMQEIKRQGLPGSEELLTQMSEAILLYYAEPIPE